MSINRSNVFQMTERRIEMVRQEWKKLFHNRILLLVVIAVIAIPSIYTTLFLGSMWDPYGKADQLPVAVVNKDQAVFWRWYWETTTSFPIWTEKRN